MIISKEDLKTLMDNRDDECITIYMPTQRGGEEAQQNPIRFKNLLKEAEERLISQGMRTRAVRELLQPAQDLLWDNLFFRQGSGLALFLSPGFLRYYRLSFNFEELVMVANRFHIKPLLSLLTGDGLFYILALSQNKVRLLQGTRGSVTEMDVEGIPNGIEEALYYDDAEKQLQFHSSTQGGEPVFRGHQAIDDSKMKILRYFRKIDRGLRELLRDEAAPLLLAGVDYLFPIYKKANSYPYLMEEGIKGNPEGFSAEELHERALEFVQPYFSMKQKDAAARYIQLEGSGLTSDNVEETVTAAYYGRVDSLFVAVGQRNLGSFNPGTNEVHLSQTSETGSEDLLNFATIHTVLNGGTAYAVHSEEVPGGASLAAIFRY